jgi:hypothetical protein
VLGKFLPFLGRRALRGVAENHRLKCPACDEPYLGLPSGWLVKHRCHSCGREASGHVWLQHSLSSPITQEIDKTGEPPAGSQIRCSESGGTRIWELPPGGKTMGLLGFAIIWLSFLALFTLSMLISPGAWVSSEHSGGTASTWLIPLACWSVGLIMLYIALRMRDSRFIIQMDARQITLTRDWRGRQTHQSLPLSQIQHIHQTIFHGSNDQQLIYGIEIAGGWRRLRFGSLLAEEEKAWLVQDLKQACLALSPGVISSAASDRTLPSATGAKADAAAPVRSKLQPFSIEIPRNFGHVIGTLMAIIGIILFLWYDKRLFVRGATLADDRLAFPALFIILFSAFLIYSTANYTRRVFLEGDGTELTLRITRFGVVLTELRFPYSQIEGLHASIGLTGDSDNNKTYKLQLRAGGTTHELKSLLSSEWCNHVISVVHRGLGLETFDCTTFSNQTSARDD